ncbi:7247_t:CDS:2, partial [Ambispora leptoticha]
MDTRPARQLARSCDKECSYKNKSAEPSVHVHHPTFIGGGTDPVDKLSAFFKDPSGVKVTKFIEKLWELSEDSKKTFDEKVRVFNLCNNDTDESTYEESASDTEDNINGKDPPKLTRRLFVRPIMLSQTLAKLQLSTGRIVEDVLFEFAKDMDYEQSMRKDIK